MNEENEKNEKKFTLKPYLKGVKRGFIFAAVVLLIYVFIVEPHIILLKKTYTLDTSTMTYKSGSPKDENGDPVKAAFKMVQFSDFHIRETNPVSALNSLVKKINNQNADIVVYTGDMFSSYTRYDNKHKDDVAEALAKIEAPHKFAVYGNHDLAEDIEGYAQIMSDGGFILLEDEKYEELEIGGKSIYVGERMNTDFEYEECDVKIILDHFPSRAANYVKGDFAELLSFDEDENENSDENGGNNDEETNSLNAFIFSGHTHGGQVILPFITRMVLPSGDKRYINEFYEVEDRYGGKNLLFITSGVGTSAFPARFLSPPSFAVFHFV